ncbi:pleiotropic drug resistance protein 3-like [Gossypium australe]|uniref:Pleiotropic drug resistance protein 3-like n=1 Tax=Gossypium australe TaxID=47621 RepID=A0A5B6W1T2_9ROSI|nr:pleiotropic drug resistance protein 3-like [Gossypium australe]
MKEPEIVNQYLDRIMAVVNQIRLLGDQFADSRVVEKVIATLLERYELKISSLKDLRDLSTILLSKLTNALGTLKELFRQKAKKAQAFQTRQEKRKSKKEIVERKKYPPCSHCKKLGHPKRFGHEEKVCKNKGQAHQQDVQEKKTETNQEELMFAAFCEVKLATSCEDQFAAPCEPSNKDRNNCLVDNGCTSHMTADANIFKSIDKSFNSKVKVGNDHRKGDVLIKTPSGTKLVTDVLLVPNIDQNLLSVGQLLEKRYFMVFNENKFLILDPSGCKLISTTMADRKFIVSWNLETSVAYTSSLDETKLWHKRMRHVDYRSLSKMSMNNLFENLSSMVDYEDVCEVRLPFPTNKAWRASEKIRLVHIGIYEPMKTSSLNGSRYFVLFIYDCTRFCWVYFIKNRSKVAGIYFKFKAMVENQIGCKLMMIRLDNRVEYTLEKFKKFSEEAGTHHQLSNVYTPQKKSERKNRTILNMTHCLLFESKLPNVFWAEVVNTVVYLQNRLPTKAVEGKISFESVWLHLLCSCSNRENKQNRLPTKAVEGKTSFEKCYRIYDPFSKKLIISRDVKFDEERIWK